MGIAISLICSTIVPIVISIILIRKDNANIKPIIFGALTFIFFQILTRIPLLQLVLPKTMWYTKLTFNIWLYALFLGLTAALYEEVGRYLVIKLFMKKQLNTESGLSFGIGHGGIEAILLVGINTIFAIIMSVDLGSSLEMTAGGIERLIALAFHVGMSIMIVKSIREKKLLWLFLPIILHTLLDFIAVISVYYGLNIYLIELIILPFAILSLIFTRKEFKDEKNS